MRKYDVDHLCDRYVDMFEQYDYITNITFPYVVRIANISFEQAKTFKDRSSIFKIAIWPNVKPVKEKRCKSQRT